MRKLFTFLLTANIIVSYAQPAKEWDKRFGGDDNDELYSFQQTSEGGFILGGHSYSHNTGDKTEFGNGVGDYWILKADANGVKQWDETFGGTDDDFLQSLQQTTDGGYILGGFTLSKKGKDKSENSRGAWDIWIIKTNVNHIKAWDKTFGGTGSDYLYSLQQTLDGGYILGGLSGSDSGGDKSENGRGKKDYWIIKIDENGIKQWDKTFGGSDDDLLYSIQQTSDGGYILGGHSQSPISGDKSEDVIGGYDFWIVKVDANGNKQWDRSYGGSKNEYLNCIKQTKDGGYLAGGSSYSDIDGDKTGSNRGLNDFWIIKIDANGEKQWDKTFGGSKNDAVKTTEQTSDEGYILGGTTNSGISGDKTEDTRGGWDYWVIKIDKNATQLWQKTYGGSLDDNGGEVHQTKDNGYCIGGLSNSGISGDKTEGNRDPTYFTPDYWIIKTESDLLPLSFLSFTATTQQNKILLNWSTANEINNDYFTIERSSNNKDFAVTGTVSSNTKPQTPNNYSYTDNMPLNGKSFYRLKQTDKDGKFSYSGVVTVTVSNNVALIIYPNPAKNYINITINKSGIATIKVYDAEGRQVINKMEPVNSGQSTSVTLVSLIAGVYYVEVSMDGEIIKERFVKD